MKDRAKPGDDSRRARLIRGVERGERVHEDFNKASRDYRADMGMKPEPEYPPDDATSEARS